MARIDRVAAILQSKISEIILRELNDPRIGFVSITEVSVAPDLKSAKVFVSIYGTKEVQDEAMKGLQSATPFIRGELGKDLLLRDVPALRFIQDTSIERGTRVLSIMNRSNKPGRKNFKPVEYSRGSIGTANVKKDHRNHKESQ
jgi:ribosome-binding factor A